MKKLLTGSLCLLLISPIKLKAEDKRVSDYLKPNQNISHNGDSFKNYLKKDKKDYIIKPGKDENKVEKLLCSIYNSGCYVYVTIGLFKKQIKEKTTYNLERIRDFLGEISKQRDTLKSHARKAKRYQALRKEANEFTRLLWSHEGREIKKQMDGFVRDEAGINAQIKIKEDKIGTAAGRLERLRSETEEKKQEIERLSNALRQAKSMLEITQRDG